MGKLINRIICFAIVSGVVLAVCFPYAETVVFAGDRSGVPEVIGASVEDEKYIPGAAEIVVNGKGYTNDIDALKDAANSRTRYVQLFSRCRETIKKYDLRKMYLNRMSKYSQKVNDTEEVYLLDGIIGNVVKTDVSEKEIKLTYPDGEVINMPIDIKSDCFLINDNYYFNKRIINSIVEDMTSVFPKN